MEQNKVTLKELKIKLTDAIFDFLTEDAKRSKFHIEVHRISNLEMNIRIKQPTGHPDYLSVKVSGS